MDILELMRTRYTTKHYDPSRRVSDADMETLLEVYPALEILCCRYTRGESKNDARGQRLQH